MLLTAYLYISPAAAQSITVDRFETSNFEPGQNAVLSAYGNGLKNVLYVWTPLGKLAYKAADPVLETVALFEGAIPDTAPPGVYEARVVTSEGISAGRFLLLDDLPSFAMTDASESRAPTTVLPLGSCVNGQVNALRPKYFGLSLEKGQEVSIEVYARRLDSPLDPVLQLSDPLGRELAFADDTAGLAGDAQLRVTAPVTGTYLLELRDVKYGGGDDYYFHLRVGTFALFQGAYPRRTEYGESVKLVGDAGEQSVVLSLPETASVPTNLSVRLAVSSGSGSSLATIATARTPPALEVEPNDTMETATAVDSAVAGLSGRFESSGDVDWFRISAEAGQHLCVTAHARDVGSPADVQLRLHDAAGKMLQQSDDNGTSDAQLALAIPSAGDVFVAVRELSGQSGVVWSYDLELQRTGRLEVSASVDSVAVPKGGTIAIPLKVKRIGSGAAFEVNALGLPPGIESSAVIVAGNQSTAFLCLRSTGDVADHFLHRLLLRCSASTDLPATSVMIVAPAASSNANYQLHSLQTGVFIYPTSPAAFSLTAASDELTVVKGAETKVTIAATRTADWSQPIDLASAIPMGELPPGVTISAVQMPADSAEITINAAANAKPGRYSVSLQGTLTKDKTTIVQPVPTITLIVSEATETKS